MKKHIDQDFKERRFNSMKKILTILLLSVTLLFLLVPVAFAEEAAAAASSKDAKMNYYAMAALGCGIAIGMLH